MTRTANETMTAAEYRALADGPRQRGGNKYGAVRTEYGGVVYDSKGEAMRAERLDLLVRAGDLIRWEGQPRLVLGPACIKYRPDFEIHPVPGRIPGFDEPWFEDFKGVETERFKVIKLLWLVHARRDLHVVKLRRGGRFETVEVIQPRRETDHD